MSGIENLALFIAATTSTLLGFIAVVFVFWANEAGRYTRDKLKQKKLFVRGFKILVFVAIGIVIDSFVAIYYSIVVPNDTWQSTSLLYLIIGFPIFIIFMGLFFIIIINDLTKPS